jgi:hypothetical protein
MNNRELIEIPCRPANPVDYLACCGLADLASRADKTAHTRWETTAPIRFIIGTRKAEAELLAMIMDTLCEQKHWLPSRFGIAGQSSSVAANFAVSQQNRFVVDLDWWYETLNEDGSVGTKSAWKMYAGQQTFDKILADMVSACARIRAQSSCLIRLSDLLVASIAMSGRFGFDPRSSRDALNVGYSPNDLKIPVSTYPFAELLAVFGAASFFPARAGTAGELGSTRGWVARGNDRVAFVYHLWPGALPVALARLAASWELSEGPALVSIRNNRKHYANLAIAKPAKTNEHEHE